MTLHLRLPADGPDPSSERWAICYGKQTFNTAAAARRCINQRKRRLTGHVAHYRCTHCGKWHIGHTNKRHKTK